MKKKVRKYEQQRKRKRNILLIVFAILILIAILAGYWLYSWIMHSNVMTPDKKDYSLYIPTGADFNQVKDSLYAHDLIYNKNSFEWVSSKKGCPDHVNPGRYVLKDGMSNYQLCNMLRGGLQTPVQVKFNNMRDIKMLAGRVGRQIEADSAEIARYLGNREVLQQLGFNERTIPALFLPNTYEFYWNTDAEKFVDKMKNEYDKFWNEDRKAKAKAVGLTPLQVSILASIVDKETNKTDEMARIAGVYLNRLKGGWLLQADPTLVFAVGDFELKRVLNVHKEVESPYNTYKYPGLPPGPICIPSLASIDAVLNPEKHSYYYFCAKDDFSGYHNFAKTLAEHNKNAQRYQRALNNKR
jgi:UPF0755 protein